MDYNRLVYHKITYFYPFHWLIIHNFLMVSCSMKRHSFHSVHLPVIHQLIMGYKESWDTSCHLSKWDGFIFMGCIFDDRNVTGSLLLYRIWEWITRWLGCESQEITCWYQAWGDHINIKISYQYRNCHDKDNTVSWLSYLYNGNAHTWKDCLYVEMGPSIHHLLHLFSAVNMKKLSPKT